MPPGVANGGYSFTLSAAGGTIPYSWTLTAGQLPAGIGLAGNGVISGTATTAAVSTFTVQVTDSSIPAFTNSQSFSLSIAPQITTGSLPASTINTPYPNTTLNANGLSGTPQWSATGLPAGMSVSPAGVLGGTPTASGNFTPAFSVTDASGAVGSANIPLTVNPAPTITDPTPLPSGDVGVPYSYQFGSSSSPVSGGTPPYTWSTTSALPPGMTFTSGGLLSGTPTQTGLYTFAIKVTDSAQASSSRVYPLAIGTVQVQVTLVLTPPASTVGVPYPPPQGTQPPYFQATKGTGTYAWTSSGLPPGIAITPTTGSLTGLSGTPTAAGTFSATITATDPTNETGSLNIGVTINPTPAINTGLQACTAGTLCTRTLTLTGGTAPFTWSLVSGNLPAGLQFNSAGVITGTPSAVSGPTTATFSVKVTDSATATNTQNLSLTVNPAMTLLPASLPATTSGISYAQSFSTSGGTGPVTFTGAGLPSWLNLTTGGALTGTTPPVATQTSYPFSVTATDSDSASATNSYTVVVNPLPAITTASPLPSWTANRPYSQTITASGGTGTLTFADSGGTLPSWLTITGGGLLSGTPPSAGPVSFTLKVTDSVSASSTKAFTFTVNPPPSVTTTSLPATTSGSMYSQNLAETGGTSPFTWQSTGLPSWLTLSPAGVLSGTAPAETTATQFPFSVTVTDAAASVSAPQSLSVTVNPGVQITTGSLPATESGLSYSQTLGSTGGTGTVTWTSTNLPSWLTLSASGLLSGTAPLVSGVTPFNFNVTATDSQSATASKSFTVTVNPPVTIATASPLPPWTASVPYTQTITATAGVTPYTFADAGATLPSWLTISAGGNLTGTPPAAGTFNFTIKVTDSLGVTNSKAFSLKINAVPGVTTTSLPATTSGLTYNQTLTESGGTAGFTFSAAGLPAWLTISGTTLGGTAPTVASATVFNFTVTVADSTGAVSVAQPLSVTVNPAVTITTANPLPTAGSGTSYSQTFTSTGGTGAIAWTFGNRPSWLTQNGATLSGTAPTVSQPTAYSFTATATDSLGANSGSQPFSVTVSSGVIITTGASLGPWTVGRPFAVTLAASGGTPPYTFADAGQTLPSWLTLNGAVLGGTPPSAGSFQFTIKATDSLSSSGTKVFTLTINAVPAVTTTSLPATTSGLAYSQSLAASGGTPPLTWSGSGLPTWLSVNGAAVSGTAPIVAAATPFPFSVSVSDAAGAVSAAQPLSVTVNPPVSITTTSPLAAATPGTAYSVTFVGAGGTGGMTWLASNLPSWLQLTGSTLSGTPPGSAAGTNVSFTIRATDTLGAFASGGFLIPVNSGPPSNGGTLPAATVSRPYSTTLTITGGTAPYKNWTVSSGALPAGLQLNSTTGAITGTPTVAGPNSFTTTASDFNGQLFPATWSLTVNPAPSVTTTSLPATTSGIAYSQPLAASGGTAPFTWNGINLPSWLAVNGSTITGTAPTVTTATPYAFFVTVTDAEGATSSAQPLSVTVNAPVSITTTSPLPAASPTVQYNVSFAATGGTGTITWTASNLPTWLGFNGNILSGTPPASAARSTINFTVRATDSVGAFASSAFQLPVGAETPVNGGTLPSGTVNRPYSTTLQMTGGVAPYKNWLVTGGALPTGLQLNAASGAITGTPTVVGPNSFTVSATDSNGSVFPATWSLTINPVPTVATTSLPATTSGVQYSQSLTANGGTAPFTWNATNLPSWLAVTGSTLAGTAPAVTSATPYAFSVTVTDSQGAVSNAQSLSVTVNPAVVITTTSPLPATNPGTAYSVSFTATGGTGAITWSASNLPSWLTLTGNTLSGTSPTSAAGTTVAFLIRATDTVGASASNPFQIQVGSGSSTNGGTLPSGTVNSAYSTSLTIVGGTPPYKNWTVSSGTLPVGLQLNSTSGAISGTPTVAGPDSFTVSATDANGKVFPATWSLTINPAPSVTATSLPATTSGLHYSQTLTATGGTAPLTFKGIGLPGWLSITGATISGTAPPVTTATPFNFNVAVTDAEGASSSTQSLSLTVNPPVSITTASPLPAATAGVAYSVSFTGSGGTGGLTWTGSSLPSWLSFNGATLGGTPPASAAGTTLTFDVRAADTLGASASAPFTLAVSGGGQSNGGTLPSWTVNRPYSASLTASGGTAPYKNWLVTGGALPASLQLNAATGAVTGTPTVAGPASFTTSATDAKGQSFTGNWSLTINPAPAIPSQSLPPAASGAGYSQALSHTGGTSPFTWSASGLDGSGIALTASGVLTGQPTATAPATINFTAILTDAAGATAQAALSLLVKPGVIISTNTLPATTSTAHYSVSLGASGGTGAIAFATAPGALPAWLTLSSQGTLTGTAPIVANPTDFDFVVTTTDSLGVSASKGLSVTVNPVPRVVSKGLPTGTVGAFYLAQLTDRGGTGALAWSVTNLPPWANLNPVKGIISGTPTAAATVTLGVVVTDSLGIASQPAALPLEIDAPGGTLTIATACPLNPTTAGQAFSAIATGNGGFPPYNWSATGLPPWLSLSASGTFSGTAVAGASAFTLQLSDSHGLNASLPCGLTVNPVPFVPATSLAPGTVGAPYSHRLNAYGGSGPLRWSSVGLPGWLSLEPLSGLLTGTPTVAGDYTFTITVTDPLGSTSAATPFTVAVTNPGGVPAITACPLPGVSLGTPVNYQLTAALGFPPYIWSATGLPAGLNASSSGVVTGTPTAAGNAIVGLSATDSANASASTTCSMNIYSGPTVTTASLPLGTVGAFYWQTLAAAGGVGPFQWSITNSPAWANLDPVSGILSGVPDVAGLANFTVQVTDSQGTQSPAVPLSVNVTQPGGVIQVTTVCPLPSLTQGALLNQVFTAAGGAPPYTWFATGLSGGALLDPSGVILGTPAAGQISFAVRATDQQQQVTQPVSCSLQVNPPPVISTTSLPNGVAGATYSTMLTATGGTGQITWSATLPSWLNIDPVSGLLSGTPPLAGPVSTAVRAVDADGIANTQTFSFSVAAPSTGNLPALTSTCPLPSALAGANYSTTLTAGGGVGPYQFFVSGLPAGLMVTSNGAITGTAFPASSTQLVVQVTDANGHTATTACALSVSPESLTIAARTPAGKVNQSYSGGFDPTGGTPPFTWTISAGALPPGIKIDTASGNLTGTPTVAGTYTFTATVTDAIKATASQVASITILPALTITSPSLPSATGGAAYQQTLAVSGATGTVTWSIIGGALPTGLTLNGVSGAISGTPTQAGTFNVTVQAVDSSGQPAQLPLTLTVNLTPIPQVTIAGLTNATVPNQQPSATLTLAAAYPLDITGTLTLTDTADPSIGITDPAVQFSSGGLSAPFRIPANSTQAVFTPSSAFQTGTLAGTLKLDVALQTGGVAVQPPASAAVTIQIPKLAPVIVGTPVVVRTSNGIQVTLVGFATSREVISGTFQFTGTNLQTSSVTVPLTSLIGGWYSSSASNAFGSMFQMVQPFTITGSPSQVTGVTITLMNSVGTSTAVTVAF